MVIIRNQAVTLIILLGYIAVTLFFLAKKFHYIWDYLAFNVPLMYSDFIGFGDLNTILIHRGIYFLLGLAFIFATIFMIKRLPQSNAMTRFSIGFFIFCLAGALFLGYRYQANFSAAAKLREQIKQLSQKYIDKPYVTPLRYDLKVEHKGSKIKASAHLVFKNSTPSKIDQYIFSLNPGLKVSNVTQNGQSIPFKQNLNIVLISPNQPLDAGKSDSLNIQYAGKIDERATYFDADEEKRAEMFKIWTFSIAKKFAVMNPNYLLLTPEANWYPIAGLPISLTFPKQGEKHFFKFNLKVKTNPKLTAISQGALTSQKDGVFQFIADRPLCQRSLVIGNYAVKSITVDSVDYRLFYLRSHDYFSSSFTDINDTLSALIREVKQDYENTIGLEYVFPRFSLVEVPIQFFYYPHFWSVSQEVIQPEMALVHEKGVLMPGADIQRRIRWQKRWMRRSKQTITPEEQQSNVFKDFLRSGLLNTGFRGMFFESAIQGLKPSYHIFPTYFTFVHQFYSPEVPLFQTAFESFFGNKTATPSTGFRRMFRGMSDDEKANIALTKQSLAEIFTDPEKKDILPSVLNIKGQYLFKYLQTQIGSDEFDNFISDYLKKHRFSSISVENFATDLKKVTSFQLMPFFKTWYQSKKLPAFLVTDITAYKVLDKDRTRFQVKFKIENLEDKEGLISVTFRRTGRRGRFFGMGPAAEQPEERLYHLAAAEIKQIGIILDEEPRAITINTLISQNIPSTITKRFEQIELNKKAVPFDGVKNLPDHLKWIEPGEIVVDNEDSSFSTISPSSKSFLKKLFAKKQEKEEKYIGFYFWSPPSKWRMTTSDNFFGKIVHSAYHIKSGSGDSKAVWTASIDKSGQYNVYYYGSSFRFPWRRNRSRKNQLMSDFHFTVYHDDGKEEVTVDMSDIETGWILLGSYYLSRGEAKVELSNKSKGRVVFADAVKWVKQ